MIALKCFLTAAMVTGALATVAAGAPNKKSAGSGPGGSTGVQGAGGAFLLDRLPAGKNVTIPRPATTLVPLSSRVMLTATDLPQSVSLKTVSPGGGALTRLRVGIHDADRVKYIDLTPGTPFLYNMKDFETITIVPDVNGREQETRHLALQVESDKPLQIAH